MGGQHYTTKISLPGGRVDRLLHNGTSDRELIQEFYLAALTRDATPDELDALQSVFAKQSSRQRTVEDFVWALISSREFSYNH